MCFHSTYKIIKGILTSEMKGRRFLNSLNLERVTVENKILIGMIG